MWKPSLLTQVLIPEPLLFFESWPSQVGQTEGKRDLRNEGANEADLSFEQAFSLGQRRSRTITFAFNMASCPNPFMLRSNDSYGMSLQEACRRATSMDIKRHSDKGPQKTCQETSSLYSRESDRIGEGVPYSDSTLSRVLRQRESDSMNKRRKNYIARQQPTDAETPKGHGISQSFSKSFNNMMYIDEGLVTSMS